MSARRKGRSNNEAPAKFREDLPDIAESKFGMAFFVVLWTKPNHFKFFGVIVMVGMNTLFLTTYFAGGPIKFSALSGISHRFMGCGLFRILCLPNAIVRRRTTTPLPEFCQSHFCCKFTTHHATSWVGSVVAGDRKNANRVSCKSCTVTRPCVAALMLSTSSGSGIRMPLRYLRTAWPVQPISAPNSSAETCLSFIQSSSVMHLINHIGYKLSNHFGYGVHTNAVGIVFK
jgi:hypothetical protein